jgi:hypothetical protein
MTETQNFSLARYQHVPCVVAHWLSMSDRQDSGLADYWQGSQYEYGDRRSTDHQNDEEEDVELGEDGQNFFSDVQILEQKIRKNIRHTQNSSDSDGFRRVHN